MIFIQNKYTKWYFQIIESAKDRAKTFGFERHHILPKSLNGDNQKTNLVYLTGREHFICHWLLTKMVTGKPQHLMICALSKMRCSNKFQNRYSTKITSRVYENIRVKLSTIMSDLQKGIPTKPHSEQSKVLMSQKAKESWESGIRSRTQTVDHIQKSSVARTGLKRSKETKQLMSNAMIGKKKSAQHKLNLAKPKSAEHRANLSVANKSAPRLSCPHCNKVGSISNMKRWHFANCKLLST